MKRIKIRVHPLSARVLTAEYGTEPIRVGHRDILYSMLTTGQQFDRNDLRHTDQLLTATLELEVNDPLALHLSKCWRLVGLHLFRWHKEQMFRFASALVRSGSTAKGAIRQWLELYDVTEDDYSADTAYKKWQRSNWSIAEKNARFFAKNRPLRGSVNSKKTVVRANRPEMSLTLREINVELAASRIMTEACNMLRRTPRCLHNQVRVYMYREMLSMKEIEIGKRLHLKQTTVSYSYRIMKRRIKENPFIGRLLHEAMTYAEQPNAATFAS